MIYFLYLRLLIHVNLAIFIVLFIFPLVHEDVRSQLSQKWSQKLLKIFDIRLQVRGQSDSDNQGQLWVSNHISWLDIHVINSYRPVRFVAKSEVANWPIFGWLARRINTLFVRRKGLGEANRVVDLISEALKAGEVICVFPEGTSTDGQSVLEFRSNMFQAPINANTSCIPIAIDYRCRVTGERNFAPAFTGDLTLIQSIRRVANSSPVDVNLAFSKHCQERFDRKSLAREAQFLIHSMREPDIPKRS